MTDDGPEETGDYGAGGGYGADGGYGVDGYGTDDPEGGAPESDSNPDPPPNAGGGADWPVTFRGVTESVVTTLGPNDRWNVAALGLHPPDCGPVRARTWGRTRTRRNFAARGGGVVQFVTDPRTFVDAAVTVREERDPVLDSVDAWVRVSVERVGSGERGGTEWVDWHLHPTEAAVVGGGVRTIERGFAAVVEATVAASRLDVDAYPTPELLDRLAYLADVVERCGGPADREAFTRLSAETGWRERDGRHERQE